MFHFRMVDSISVFAFRVSIDGHKLQAIASDGEYFDPVEVDYIIIHAGETYDFLLEANNQDGSNFWIRAETLLDSSTDPKQSTLAILTYGDFSDLDWTSSYSNVPERARNCTAAMPCRALNCPFEIYPADQHISCISLTSLVRRTATEDTDIPSFPPDPGCSDCMHFLNFAFQGKDLDSSVNSISLQLPQTSYATSCFQYENEKNDSSTNTCNKCEIDSNSMTGGCSCIDVVPVANSLTFNSTAKLQPSVAMVLSSLTTKFAHPIHLHGHAYTIVYVGYGQYNTTTGKLTNFTDDIDCGSDTLCVNPRWRNGIPQAVSDRTTANGQVVSTAIRKDTVIIPAGGYVVIAFEANNPGFWIMHCHIEEHLLDGMAILVQEYGASQQWSPPAGINLHGSFNWNVSDYNSFLSLGQTCGSEPTSPSQAPLAPSTSCSVSRPGFIVTLLILALLLLAVIVLTGAIVSMSFYIYKQKSSIAIASPSPSKEEPVQATAEIEMTAET